MKKLICFLVCIGMLISSFCVIGMAEEQPIKVVLNGEELSFDVNPITLNGRTLVPFRKIFEAFSCTVSWDEMTQTAIGVQGTNIIKLSVGNQLALLNGESVYLDQAPVLEGGRTLVPLRFIGESLGATVSWEDATKTVNIVSELSKENQSYLFIPDSFAERGTWSYDSPAGSSLPGGALRGGTDQKPENTEPAVATFMVENPGEYQIWVRSRDYPNDRPGIRFFQVEVNGIDTGNKYGTHGKEGFAWANGGTVNLVEGENKLSLVDSAAFYGRCDGVFITKDKDLVPSDDFTTLVNDAFLVEGKAAKIVDYSFPAYAKEEGTVVSQVALENETTKVVFYKVSTSKGEVVQNEIYSKNNGEWVLTKKRAEGLGYLLVSTQVAKYAPPIEEAQIFNTAFSADGEATSYYGTNIYKAGNTIWLLPTGVEKQGEKIVLTAQNDVADLKVEWSLENEGLNATVTTTYKNDGAYTVGAFEGGEMPIGNIEEIKALDNQSGLDVRPDPGILYIEDYLTSPGALITVKDAQGVQIQKGVEIVGGSLEKPWKSGGNKMVGVTLRGIDGNFQAGVFAPVLGSDASLVNKGQAQSFTYKVISTVK